MNKQFADVSDFDALRDLKVLKIRVICKNKGDEV